MSGLTLSQFVSYAYLAGVIGLLLYGFTARSTETRRGVPAISRFIDAYNERVARTVAWFLVITIIVSTANATSRYALNLASNAWLELQWNLFAVAFLFGAAWTLKLNEHVRIDIFASTLPQKARDWIDVFGHVVFLFPFTLVHLWYGFDYFLRSFSSGETSTHAGGLIFWPAKLVLMLGFTLLLLQGVSELLKRLAIIRGDMEREVEVESAAEREVKEILEQHGVVGAAPGKPH
jgi:TRAP-type mannitol/chloroaromatic compound transport system permease small subunit